MSERVLTDKITMRPYGDDGWAFSDDGCGCGAGGLAVMQTGGEPFAVEQHIAGCGDDDLPARVIFALATCVAELEAENAKLKKSSDLALSLAEEFERAVASREPVHGIQVTPSGDFIACAQLPSAVKRMAWWAREIRAARAEVKP